MIACAGKKFMLCWFLACLLFIYYGLTLYGAITSGNIAWTLGVMFVPMVTIPMNLFVNLFVDFWTTLFDIGWLALSFYLMSRDD